MTRDTIKQEILNLKGNNFLFELPTGTGKTKLAIDKIKSLIKPNESILIVVPRNVLKDSWKSEFKKWWPKNKHHVEYTTYVSFPKYKGKWDFVIFDEGHHLSERCRESLCDFTIKYSIILSATVNRGLKDELKEVFSNIVFYKMKLREAIEENILPEPEIYLCPLTLDNKIPTNIIVKNPKAKGNPIKCSWARRWECIMQKNHPIHIYCTESQYYIDLCSQIEYWKRRSNSIIGKNKWLKLCGDRLKWLSTKKMQYLYKILAYLSEYRTITFCNNIEQTELLGDYCINSKNANSFKYLNDFNEGRINHITACNMLNEGMNLTNCQIGIYGNLNSSETIIKQRLGRILRHPKPKIIIPYFKNTREEELVQKMLEDYNPELITVISNINEIKI